MNIFHIESTNLKTHIQKHFKFSILNTSIPRKRYPTCFTHVVRGKNPFLLGNEPIRTCHGTFFLLTISVYAIRELPRGVSLRRNTMNVSWEECGFPHIFKSKEAACETFQSKTESSMRRHAVFMHHQVTFKKFNIHATLS